jgi:hypothetical protein
MTSLLPPAIHLARRPLAAFAGACLLAVAAATVAPPAHAQDPAPAPPAGPPAAAPAPVAGPAPAVAPAPAALGAGDLSFIRSRQV